MLYCSLVSKLLSQYVEEMQQLFVTREPAAIVGLSGSQSNQEPRGDIRRYQQWVDNTLVKLYISLILKDFTQVSVQSCLGRKVELCNN